MKVTGGGLGVTTEREKISISTGKNDIIFLTIRS